MTTPHYTDGPVTIWHGDCIDVMRAMPDASVDAVVTDPPYGLNFMGKDWDSPAGQMVGQIATGLEKAANGPLMRGGTHSRGYADNDNRAFQAWCELWATEAYRLLKPGGHLLAFGGTRTFHRLTSGIEDAGFEIRDSIAWLYGQGFPKSADPGCRCDREPQTQHDLPSLLDADVPAAVPARSGSGPRGAWPVCDRCGKPLVTGLGSALKPSFEPVVVARKPLTGTLAATVAQYGTGALNIDGSRIPGTVPSVPQPNLRGTSGHFGSSAGRIDEMSSAPAGRWPANVVLDASQAAALDAQSGVQRDGIAVRRNRPQGTDANPNGIYSTHLRGPEEDVGFGGSGGASRFFKTVDTVAPRFMYTAKAGSDERPTYSRTGKGDPLRIGIHANICELCGRQDLSENPCRCPEPQWVPRGAGDTVAHPTVKPLDLMRWLVKLVTPPGGTVLEPFAGSGTTVEAAVLDGFRCIAIEREGDYLPLILQRVRKPHAVGLDLDWDAPTPAPTPIRPAQGRTGPRSAAPAPHPGFDFGDDWELDA